MLSDVLRRASIVQGWMSEEELAWLFERATSCKRVVEIGSHRGRSSIALVSGCRGVMYCVDIWSDPDVEADFMSYLRPELDLKRLVMVKKASIIAHDDVPSEIDLVFIDGAHDYRNVMDDICTWTPKVRTGGLIVGHDYDAAWPGVMTAVDEVFVGSILRGPGSIWYVEI